MTQARAGQGLALLSVIGFTGVNTLTRSAAATIDPLLAAILRTLPLVAVSALACALLRPPALRAKSARFMGVHAIALLGAAGVVSYCAGNVLFTVGMAKAGLANSAVALQGSMLVCGVAASTWWLKERPSRWEFIGAVITLVGLLIPLSGKDSSWLGIVLVAVAGACYTVGTAAGRAVQRQASGMFLPTLLITNAAGALGLGLMLPILGSSQPADQSAVWAMLGVGLANLVATGAFVLAARYVPVSTISLVSALVIVTSVVVAYLVFAEQPGPPLLAGALLILAGVLVSQR